MDFDEQKAIEFIRKRLPNSADPNIDDDEILNIIDMIFDYYEENGFCNVDADDDLELDVDDLLAYVKKMVAHDQDSPFSVEEVEAIVSAELEFEDSLL